MALFPWLTDTGVSVQDDTSQDIIFKKTAAQVLPVLTITATMNLIKPMGSVKISPRMTITPTMTTRVFLGARILIDMFINTSANSRVNKWSAIMFKYIGDRS